MESPLGVRSAPRSVAALCALTNACALHTPCNGLTCAATCPREAAEESGRCACVLGDVPVLGACVPQAVADAYCGPAASYGVGGCVFRSCGEGSVLDAATGACLPRMAVAGAAEGDRCGEGRTKVVAQGRSACVPAELACPRGTLRAGPVCARPPTCPPGTLFRTEFGGTVCRPVVTVGAREDLARVDLGAWAAMVLGPDGGPGTSDLCRPLLIRPDIFGFVQGSSSALRLRIAVAAPDQDLTRAFARVGGEVRTGGTASHPLSAEAQALALASVSTLVEALRGLGGEASTAIVELRVSCTVQL